MNKPIKCAVYGTGHAHMPGKLEVLQRLDQWEVVGVCEPDSNRKSTLKNDPNTSQWNWISEEKLLTDRTIKMIAIESDVLRLMPLATKAVEAGKHIHLDKPPGIQLDELRQIQDIALPKKRIIQMGYMFRYNEGFKLVRQAFQEGWLGHVHYMHAAMVSSFGQDQRDTCAFHPAGILLEFGGHLFDQIVMLMGKPQKITPYMRHDGKHDDQFTDHCTTILEYERALVVVETSALEGQGFARRIFEVVGSNGSIILQPLEPPAVRLLLAEPAGGYKAGVHNIDIHQPPRYEADLVELAQCISNEQPLPYTSEHDFLAQETFLRACGVDI